MLTTLNILPEDFSANSVMQELADTAADAWLVGYLAALDQIRDGGLAAINKTASEWQDLGVPEAIAPDLTANLAEWLLQSVGAKEVGFYLEDWPVAVKLAVAEKFLPDISKYRGSLRGLELTLAVFVGLGYLPDVSVDEPPNREDSGEYTPSIYLSGWDSYDGSGPEGFDKADRGSSQFQTLRLIAEYHNPSGYGLAWADWTECRADIAGAQDRCS